MTMRERTLEILARGSATTAEIAATCEYNRNSLSVVMADLHREGRIESIARGGANRVEHRWALVCGVPLPLASSTGPTFVDPALCWLDRGAPIIVPLEARAVQRDYCFPGAHPSRIA